MGRLGVGCGMRLLISLKSHWLLVSWVVGSPVCALLKGSVTVHKVGLKGGRDPQNCAVLALLVKGAYFSPRAA